MRSSDKPATAFALSLIAGILILISGVILGEVIFLMIIFITVYVLPVVLGIIKKAPSPSYSPEGEF